MKAIRGTPYRSACRHTVSDCGSTPATASNTATAPSSTRSDRSTSAVKSTCPGVERSLRVDRKSTRLNSSHGYISYAVFCLKKKNTCNSLLLLYEFGDILYVHVIRDC